MRTFFILACLLILFSCSDKKSVVNKFSDPVHIRIAEYQDRRYSDSLYQYFNNEKTEYRVDAVLAFASVQDTLALRKLSEVLLRDTAIAVRKAAAFSLGQLPAKGSAAVLENALKTEKDPSVIAEILDARGKQTSTLVYTKTYSGSLEGLAWSLYRAGLRGITDSTIFQKAIELLAPQNNLQTRSGAAHFLARTKGYDTFQQSIIRYAFADSSADVRMALTLSLRRITTDSSLMAIKKIAGGDPDYRVRVSAVRSLQSFPFEKTKAVLLKAITDENVNVGVMASEVLKAVSTKESSAEIQSLARNTKNGRIQANLYEAALRAVDNKELAEEIRSIYEKTKDPYHKAALLTALQQSVMSYEFVQEQIFKADTPVVRSAAASALIAINYHKNFDSSLKQRFAEIYQKAMELNDLAVIGTIAGALGDSTLRYITILKDFTFLYRAKEKLSLPRDNEALQPVEAAIAYLEGKKSAPVVNEFNHPIDWALVKTIPKDQLVRIKTTKGDIIIQLKVEEAPGSVANFVALANQKYFDQKFFHRVVPNFVVQAGCNRGDGWGSEDYSIRSEFSTRRYTTGSVGMASAGKDTEGTQWFITHSPTPHLDGRYTIFAEVTEGMDVVHRIEVGDMILSVELSDRNP
ncbi:MAG TPA: peptidylprolyl isomerase [Ohtaekwangia sp.]